MEIIVEEVVVPTIAFDEKHKNAIFFKCNHWNQFFFFVKSTQKGVSFMYSPEDMS